MGRCTGSTPAAASSFAIGDFRRLGPQEGAVVNGASIQWAYGVGRVLLESPSGCGIGERGRARQPQTTWTACARRNKVSMDSFFDRMIECDMIMDYHGNYH